MRPFVNRSRVPIDNDPAPGSVTWCLPSNQRPLSGPYTEALLVGNLALRLQKPIEWDAAAMQARNASEAEPLIRKTYRPGFGIAG